MKKIVAFVTYQGQAALTADDALAATALRKATNIEVVAVPWDHSATWEGYEAVVLRSTWDYFRRPTEFIRWLEDLKRRGARVFNPTDLAIWNAEKTYLRALAAKIPIVPTRWVDRGEQVDLEKVLSETGWAAAVIKPTISGTAFETWITSPARSGRSADQTRLNRLLSSGGVMIQPYLEEIVTRGEWSIVYFNGEYSHAVLKTPASGDFRVQKDFGGSWRALTPPPALVAHGRHILEVAFEAAGQATPLYARVDGVLSASDDRFLLMELELIEPVLFFAADEDEAPARFASALARRLRT